MRERDSATSPVIVAGLAGLVLSAGQALIGYGLAAGSCDLGLGLILSGLVRGIEVWGGEVLRAHAVYDVKRSTQGARSLYELTAGIRARFVASWSRVEMLSSTLALVACAVGSIAIDPHHGIVLVGAGATIAGLSRLSALEDDRPAMAREVEMAQALVECADELACHPGGAEAGLEWYLEAAREVRRIAVRNSRVSASLVASSWLVAGAALQTVPVETAAGLGLLGYRGAGYAMTAASAWLTWRRYRDAM